MDAIFPPSVTSESVMVSIVSIRLRARPAALDPRVPSTAAAAAARHPKPTRWT